MKTYSCFVNGELYGKGSLEYMLELLKDYVVTCEMYGKSEITFKIAENVYPLGVKSVEEEKN